MARVIFIIIVLLTMQACTSAIVAGTVATVASVNDPRSIGSQVDDSSIEIEATLKFMRDDNINTHTNLSVVSYNGNVLVVGQSPNQLLIDNAIKILSAIKGVKKVHNQIKLGTPASLSTKTTDAWLTTKVKSRLLTDEVVEGHKIKVVTENKTVFLMGVVDGQQGNLAANIAAEVAGVEKVVKVFEH